MRTKAYSHFAVILLLASLVGCGSQLPYDAVCAVEMQNCSGSGTLVGVTGDYALVLTCRHVAGHPQATTLTWRDGQKTNGFVVEVLPPTTPFAMRNDLALIICDRPEGIDPAPLAKFDPANAPFTSIGYRRKALYISNARSAAEEMGLITLSAPAVPGMSGGGTFDRNGALVGVCVGSDFDLDSGGNLVRIGDWSVAADGDALAELVRKYQ